MQDRPPPPLETAVYFPAEVVVDPALGQDVTVVFTANLFEGFRWLDGAAASYTGDVWDASTDGYEPVRRLGVNAYQITYD